MSKDENVRKVTTVVCSELYSKWKEEKKWYKNVPKKGIKVDIEYIDTNPNASSSIPVVLCLHGSPGSHQNFASLRQHLHQYSLRIICPNFPTYKLTKTKKFGHFVEEKTHYILDFLRAINVTKVDMIVGHSSAIYPSMSLLESEIGASLKSLVFLNPSGHRTFRAVKYRFIVHSSAFFYQYKFFRFFIKAFGKPILFVTGCPVDFTEMDSLFLTATTFAHSRFKKLPEQLNKLRESNTSTLLVFSENDKLIQKEIFYDMGKLIGVSEENVVIYNQQEIKQEPSLDKTSYPKAVVLKDGGHYSFLTHSKIVNEEIAQMIHGIFLNDTNCNKVDQIQTGEKDESLHEESAQNKNETLQNKKSLNF